MIGELNMPASRRRECRRLLIAIASRLKGRMLDDGVDSQGPSIELKIFFFAQYPDEQAIYQEAKQQRPEARH
ncbi:hypothetical protein CPY51_24320 [Rhizobium tubonense]|uniref:Uncharacterized protein n=1 Tax=Rhizobium tubonense TaxID=484088 RepID=A0A2W4CXG9_9HYPH|nr:hypothetical protein CPY51_24320 [Rhizobium tubonense]